MPDRAPSELPDVMGAGEVCAMLGVSKQRLKQLRDRGDFPPARELACGPIWSAPLIRAWKHDRATHSTRYRVVASYLKLGNTYRVAKSTGIPYSTVHRHLVAAGMLGAKPSDDPMRADLRAGRDSAIGAPPEDDD